MDENTEILKSRIAELEKENSELKIAEKHYREIFDHMKMGVVVYNSPDNGQNFIVKDINRFGLENGSLKKENVIGKEVAEVFPGMAGTNFIDNLKEVYRTGNPKYIQPFNYKDELTDQWAENRLFRLPDGNIAALYENVTEKIKSREKLKASEEMFRAIFENTGAATCTFGDDAVINQCNSKFEELSGFSKEEIIGKLRWTDFVHPVDLEIMIQYHGMRSKNEEAPTEYEFRFYDKDKKLKNIKLKIGLIPSEKIRVASLIDITFHKNTEYQLKEASKRLEIAIQAADGAVYDYYLPVDDRFYASPKWKEITGFDLMELNYDYKVLEFWYSRVHPEDYKYFAHTFGDFKDGKSDFIDRSYRFRHADGHYIYIHTTAKAVERNPDGSVRRLVGIGRDVTQSKRYEEILKKSEAKYRNIFENAGLPIIVTNTDKLVVNCNSEFLDLTGFTKEEVINKKYWTEFINKKHLAELLKNTDIRDTGGTPKTNYDLEVYDKFGNKLFVTIKIGYEPHSKLRIIAIHDLTLQRQMEKALQDSERRLRAIIDSAKDIIFFKDTELRYTSVNKTLLKFYDFQSHEIIGKTDYDIYPEDFAKTFTEEDLQVLDGTELQFENDLTVNGVVYTFDVIKVPIRDNKGKIIGLCGYARDISFRKKFENRIKNINQQLEKKVHERTLELEDANHRLKSTLNKERELNLMKSRFISMISHEYRTPLTIILNSIEIIRMLIEQENYSGCKKYLKNAESSVKIMTDLLEDVITVGNTESGNLEINFEKTELISFLNELAEELKIIYPGEKIILESSLEHLEIQIDKKLLRQIFSNLVSNGIKYSPKDEKVYLKIIKNSSYVTLRFIDHGKGMSKEELEKIFTPFYRNNDHIGKIPGSGLGLSIVKSAVEALNGKITVESKPGVGSEFTVFIPFENAG